MKIHNMLNFRHAKFLDIIYTEFNAKRLIDATTISMKNWIA